MQFFSQVLSLDLKMFAFGKFAALFVVLEQLANVQAFTFGAGNDTMMDTKDMKTTMDNEILTRQLVGGTLPGGVPAATTCVCVPPGQCTGTVVPNPPTDGTGQIDIRIVNNPSVPPTAPQPPACNYGLVNCCTPGAYRCGMRYGSPPGSRAPGPGQAQFGAYPWQAAILSLTDVYIGSGALIDKRHVLTAAHKVFNLTANAFRVRLGEWDASVTTEPVPAENVDVARVFVHPNFNPNNLQNDVALIRLSADVNLNQKSTIGTVCMPSMPSYVGQRCYVAGWGRDAFGPTGAYQAIMKDVDVPVMTNAQCQSALRRTRLGATFVLNDNSFVCAGGELGKDACTGDGGSPLVCLNNGQWQVIGLAAWGIGCGAAGSPGVYANVASFLPWIQTTLVAA